MKILLVFGTRPEAIKMAILAKILKQKLNNDDIKICVTAQHRDILDQVLNTFDVIPDFDMNLMQKEQSLSDTTCNVIKGLENIFKEWMPDWLFVHGDTLTTMAASISAYYHKIKVAHVEAGLRSHNKHSPWPEEINRKIVACIADLHFAPTENAKKNLLNEGINNNNIFVTGNTVIDALFHITNKIEQDNLLMEKLSSQFSWLDKSKKLVLITCHRRENFGEGINNIIKAIKIIAQRPDIQIAISVHPNPNIKELIFNHLKNTQNIFLLPPQEYISFVFLMKNSYLILTDSGGIQEEAPALGIPVLVMRNHTERQEAISSGLAKLIGLNTTNIVEETNNILDNNNIFQIKSIKNIYGDGLASERIYEALKSQYL